MRRSRYIGVSILCLFFFLVLAIAFVSSDLSATMIIGGENSVGEWMSGVLLVISATVTAVDALRRGWRPWMIFSLFFILLAVDENFMIHEAIKRHIVFSSFEKTNHPIYWIGELPVILAACFGAVVAWMLWKNIDKGIRWLIPAGVIFEIASVTIDVMSAGVLWEDSLKLIGELCVTSALGYDVQKQ
ncbi:MAG: hypothetical protein WDO14_08720 [Bacteroidota bacterium]